jgi:hypothetical protein
MVVFVSLMMLETAMSPLKRASRRSGELRRSMTFVCLIIVGWVGETVGGRGIVSLDHSLLLKYLV